MKRVHGAQNWPADRTPAGATADCLAILPVSGNPNAYIFPRAANALNLFVTKLRRLG
jgi:hypothetical protein